MRRLIALAGLATLTACAQSGGEVHFNREAGAVIDRGDLGAATLNNTQVMTGEKQWTIDLARRFAAEVDSTVTFPFDSAQLDGTARATLRRQADWIRQFPEVRFRVFGHTDLVGSDAYNRALGLRRARAVVGYLGSLGISRARLEAVVSYGETRPLIVTPDRERRNRRTVTEVSGFVKNHPQLLDGKYAQVIYREYVASARPVSGLTGVDVGASEDTGG